MTTISNNIIEIILATIDYKMLEIESILMKLIIEFDNQQLYSVKYKIMEVKRWLLFLQKNNLNKPLANELLLQLQIMNNILR
ncbi:hypothetical protein [Bacillus sp. SRB3LM]|uniref:hypothetical protein n=1 Tax=Bacillus sp. SRB3LM TaxID=2608689 RepID=UPI0018C36B57|nr:hypothetical protein [Bacillus sp. SRB3LM]MBG0970680.1 hypothetical protein [Bacillus sp. SRB3LM]MBG0972728.1 hypothetical protein [Bacillus sp. SRB3LM]